MQNTPSTFTQRSIHHRSFILRITWEGAEGQWCLQVQPVNGEATRLFCDSESFLLYLEALRQAATTKESPAAT